MSSELGRTLIRDVVSDLAGDYPGQCADLVRCQLQLILDRAAQRHDPAPSAEQLIDAVVALMIYRILFAPEAPSAEQVRDGWMAACQVPERHKRAFPLQLATFSSGSARRCAPQPSGHQGIGDALGARLRVLRIHSRDSR